ncbi:MAG: hypothetical protein QXU88_01395 [Candidatus Woesearchaeota archaeon]
MLVKILISLSVLSILFLAACSGSREVSQHPQERAINEPLKAKITVESCSDSDGGKEPSVQGLVRATLADGTSLEAKDECLLGLLVENYCDGSKPANVNIRCQNNCSNGRCL